MSNEEKLRAFAMRLEGKTWDEIGAELHYTKQAVHQALYSVLCGGERSAQIVYPEIREYIARRHDGSVSAFAADIEMGASYVRRVLFCGEKPSAKLSAKITSAMGVTEEEAFRK